MFQQYIADLMVSDSEFTANTDPDVSRAVQSLAIICEAFLCVVFRICGLCVLLDEANELGCLLHFSEFYNETVNEEIDIKEDFPHWKAKEGSVCDTLSSCCWR